MLALVRDLIFASKILAAGRAAGIEVLLVRDGSQLMDQPGSLLLADLNQAGAIIQAAEWKQSPQRRVIGFVSHVDTAAIQEARSRGIDRILARSAFTKELPQLLASVAPPSEPT